MKILRALAESPYGYLHYRHVSPQHKQAVIIAHINQQSSALMIELLQALGTSVHAIAFDYPSYGMSDPIIDRQPTIEDYGRCMMAVLDDLGIERATVMGEATGAHVAIEAASAYPQRVDHAVLVNCPYYPHRGVEEAAHAPLKAKMRPADPSGFPMTRTLEWTLENDPGHSPLTGTQDWMDRINRAQIEGGRQRWQALDALALHQMMPKLPRIQCPTLILMGDHFHYLKDLPELTSKLQRGENGVVENGRFCMAWERADEVARRVLDFLDRTPE